MGLTVHHLQVSQSERIPWLCEELNILYKLVLHQRAPIFSPQSIKNLHPTGQAPVIQDGSLTLPESGACVEYIINTYGRGKLALPPSHKDYADYLYWFHFSNGSLQPLILGMLQIASIDSEAPSLSRSAERLKTYLSLMNTRLLENTWLAGDEFTAADIMIFFSLTTVRSFYPIDLTGYQAILGYLKRASEREGYKTARAKADPELELMIDGEPPRSFFEKLRAEGKI